MRIAERRRQQKRRLRGRIWRGFEGLGIVIAIFTGTLAWLANDIAGQALKDQRIATAWQLLSLPNSAGRRYALEALVNETDEALSGIDFGCGAFSQESEREACGSRTRLDRMMLSPAIKLGGKRRQIEGLALYYANLTSATIKNISLRNAYIYKSSFYETVFENVSIIDSTYVSNISSRELPDILITLPGIKDHLTISNSAVILSHFKNSLYRWVFDNTLFRDVSFQGADISETEFKNTDWTGPKYTIPDAKIEISALPDINLTSTTLCKRESNRSSIFRCTKGIDDLFFDRAFYIGDAPPIGIEHFSFALDDLAHCIDSGKALRCEKGDQHWTMSGV